MMKTADDRTTLANTFWFLNLGAWVLNLLKNVLWSYGFFENFLKTQNLRWFIVFFTSCWLCGCSWWSWLGNILSLHYRTHFGEESEVSRQNCNYSKQGYLMKRVWACARFRLEADSAQVRLWSMMWCKAERNSMCFGKMKRFSTHMNLTWTETNSW